MISPTQMRQARAALEMSQGDVAAGVGMTKAKIFRLEKGMTDGVAGDLKILQTFFENRGLEFTGGNGVRERQETLTYRGQDGFRRFMDDVYGVCKAVGGQVRLYNARPENWTKWGGEEWIAAHLERMEEVYRKKEITFLITSKSGDRNFLGKRHAEYRWVPDEMFNQRSFYVYGDRLALLSFEEDSVEIFVIRKQQFADSFLHLFDVAWKFVAIVPPEGGNKPEDGK